MTEMVNIKVSRSDQIHVRTILLFLLTTLGCRQVDVVFPVLLKVKKKNPPESSDVNSAC